ncbi:tunicamycin resistance protein [Paenibacillus nanensis]|uniref:Tunicamycin resistance protein n=1 Tax=Paenibacillus nanensis TaxID=393251 RepID=A0A3A1UZK2_9BACL|nr:AAA family ATPase [Paenibacillus nanensis]RIX53704.1 tunicamycin resistance protein [Paenibacillus nanensis]
MIIWLNGAFGAGKTQTAHELHNRLPGSFLYDPENVGYFLRKNIPDSMRSGDFQNLSAWRECNLSILRMLDAHHKGPIIVPMTLVVPSYFDEIVGELRRVGVDVQHFALCASKEVILKRLRKRGDGAQSWPALQADRCVEALLSPVFKHHILTDTLTISETAERIAAMAGLELIPDNRGKVRKAVDRIRTQVKHIRWF